MSDDLIATGGAFYLSTVNDEKFTVDVTDALRIDSGGAFTADTSGGGGGLVSIFIDGLRLGSIGSGSGDLTLIGENTTLDQTGATTMNLGQVGPAQLTLSDRARATFAAPIVMANLASGATSANVLVESGSRLNLNSLRMTTVGFVGGVSADLTVTGASSVADLSGLLTVGGSSSANATVNVTNSGRLDVGGATTVNTSGILNVDGGTLNAMAGLDASAGTLNHNDGVINVTGGSFVPIANPLANIYQINGANPGDLAEVIVGAGASLDVDDLRLGSSDREGSLILENGGTASAEDVFLGGFTDSVGAMIVRGAGSTLTTPDLIVASSGNGTLDI